MIVDFTEEEIKKLNALNKNYDKLIKEQEELVLSLRPDDPEPDIDEYDRLQDSYPTPPAMPELEPNENGQYAYSVEAMDAYRESDEYKAYEAERDRIDQAIDKLYDDWYNAGSDEWKAASKRLDELVDEAIEADKELRAKIVEKHFADLGGDSALILKDAKSQVDRLIPLQYKELDNRRSEGSVRSKRARVQDDGSFLLDTEEMSDYLLQELKEHIEALGSDRDTIRKLKRYIKTALHKSELVGDTGDLGGVISQIIQKHETTVGDFGVTRPREYKYANAKVSHVLFNNALTTRDPKHFTPVTLNKEKNVQTYAQLIVSENVVGLPFFDDFDERVLGGVVSCLLAGNNFIPYTTLYNRGMLGLSPNEKNKEVTPAIKADIRESLSYFVHQVRIDNDPTGELRKKYEDFDHVRIKAESILFYQDREEKVRGQVTEGIAIPENYIPVLYRYAEANNNEIITDRIESIHVDGMNYSRKNMTIASATYKRVKEIQYRNSKKKYRGRELTERERTITYEAIAEKILSRQNWKNSEQAKQNGEDFTPKTYGDLSQTERNRLKKVIDKCMSSYMKNGLFERYEHKKDKTKTFYAVVLYFEKEPDQIENSNK